MKGRIIDDLSRGRNNKWRCWFEFDDDPRRVLDKFVGKELDIAIKEYRPRRSKDANSFMWVLLDRLAAAVHSTKTEIYLNYVREYGVYKDFTLTEDEAKTFRVAWEKLGTGWPTEQVDYAPDGEHVVIRAYYGSSTYTTKRMSRLIDAIVQDCKAVGIETITPEELKSMLGSGK